MHNVT